MTVKDVFNAVNNARIIKKWPGEYRVYAPNVVVFIYLDDNDMPEYYVYTVDGKQHPFTEYESKELSALVEKRYISLCQSARQDMLRNSKTK